MSIDLRTVIGHQLSAKEIVAYPSLLSKDLGLKQTFITKQKKVSPDYLTKSWLNKINEEIRWENVTEKDLINAWTNNENPELLDENGYICCVLDTYFGCVTFNKQTITIVFFPEHKYSNMFHEPQKSFIFDFSEKLALSLGGDKVIYCSDTHPTEQIERWSYEGLSIDTIEELSKKMFGVPHDDIEQAIENRFLIKSIKHNP